MAGCLTSFCPRGGQGETGCCHWQHSARASTGTADPQTGQAKSQIRDGVCINMAWSPACLYTLLKASSSQLPPDCLQDRFVSTSAATLFCLQGKRTFFCFSASFFFCFSSSSFFFFCFSSYFFSPSSSSSSFFFFFFYSSSSSLTLLGLFLPSPSFSSSLPAFVCLILTLFFSPFF